MAYSKYYYKKAEEMLSEYTMLQSEIKNLELDIEESEKEYKGCGAIAYEERTSSTNAFNSSVENEMLSRRKRMDSLVDLKRSKEIRVERINNALEVLNNKEIRIIELKFFSERKKSWTNVSRKIDMCEAWCRKLKDRAIEKMIPILFVFEVSSEKVAKK
ncbi:hypothetical protein [Clostridium magnum]|uniref:Sigma factor n=1 Tax=Clostridium magnum DSM 2767 TaxID=1121326 RepID=A0A162QM14_9CLOT|nr:hypothetical protein [Clostridium magnum]KZL88697.1 hypothetical protein CLMAG_59860 [Clostridium magnum DSM 2767]SHJ64025.1 hypothetical protein SAMN02745944_06273 [Clostridium magnum DSM 2767]